MLVYCAVELLLINVWNFNLSYLMYLLHAITCYHVLHLCKSQ